MKVDEYSLYQLTPNEFEMLCAEILKAEGIEHLDLVGGPGDQWVDIIGETEGQRIAVQVTHARQLSVSRIRRIIDQVQASSYQPTQLIIMCSARLTPSLKESVHKSTRDISIRFIDQGEILKALNDHPEIHRLQVAPAQRRAVRQRWELIVGLTAALSSIVAWLASGTFFFLQPEKPRLQERIETVERAIGSLKDLEKQLIDIKRDMVETEKARKVIEQEYTKARELEKVTQEQFEAVRSALRSQSWQKTALNFVLGFILGIASSLIASVVHSRIQQHRALRDNSNNA
jgi:hypothetical protein